MVAILLYVIGLITAVATVVLVGFDATAIYQALVSAYDSGTDALLPALGNIAQAHAWALNPFLGGLLLMGFARIMMLLGAIRNALRGPA